ncbi:MAG: hypothetical protein JHC74_01590 [Thermoleophilia bacterium]|nr:hypothetical protein [Thermoleophilia bacterium]
MTVITRTETDRELPLGALPVAEWGLLSRVARPCPDHGGECPCVARDAEAGCLVFWCDNGEHHFSNR